MFGINYDVADDNIGTTTAPPQFQTTESVTLTTATPNFLAGGGLPANATFSTLAQQRAATSAYVPNQELPYSEQRTLGVQAPSSTATTRQRFATLVPAASISTVQTQLNVQSPVTAANQLPTNLTGGSVSFNPV